jgi:hypothetical protein
MTIQLDGPAAGNVEAAQRSLEALAQRWGYDIAQSPAGALPAATSHDENRRAIDPVSVAAVVLSIPSAALAVLDLADRIHKRRRASELIDHAQQLANQHVAVRLISQGHTTELSTMALISFWSCWPEKTRPAEESSPQSRQPGHEGPALPSRQHVTSS